MIRFLDAATLAYTKLRTHKIRTGLTVGVAGILFGLILAVIIVAQGVFDSLERFDEEGLGGRTIVNVSRFATPSFMIYEHTEDKEFIAEIEAYHEAYVAKKTQLAQEHNIPYDPEQEDATPISKDTKTGQKYIDNRNTMHPSVAAVAQQRYDKDEKMTPLDIDAWAAPYQSAKVIENAVSVAPEDGSLLYMLEGKEQALVSEAERQKRGGRDDAGYADLRVLSGELTKPFVVADFDPTRGELPGIFTFSDAEQLLGLKRLGKDSTNQQRLDRLAEVRSRISEITVSFCYRNAASQGLLEQAKAQHEEKERSKRTGEYTEPSLQYALPVEDSCGEVSVQRDIRTEMEKSWAERRVAFEEDLGTHVGEPVQHKVTVRGVGIAGDAPGLMEGLSSMEGMVTSMLGSWLTYEKSFVIPADLLEKVPAEFKPSYIFTEGDDNVGEALSDRFRIDAYFVEFTDKKEARDALEKGGMFGGEMVVGDISVGPYGSQALVVDEMKTWFSRILLWTIGVVGGVALIILASLIGRMVADGRRESAVFRAIGARRSDIAGIYGAYALLLSLRTALFALILAFVLVISVELLLWQETTVTARLAYAAVDTTKEFHFIGLGTWYIPMVLGAIVVVGLLASVIPILLGARRNPINDMRNDG